MALQRSYLSKLMLSLLDAEATYDGGPTGWTSSEALTLTGYEDATAHEVWSDVVQSDADTITGSEFPLHQEIARQGLTLDVQYPRVYPTMWTGLLALVLGAPISTTQDGSLTAYRHRFEPANSTSLPSIAAQAVRDQGTGTQYQYNGLKGESWVLSENGPYWRLNAQLLGSGSRTTAADSFPTRLVEPWLPLGGARIYLKDTGGTPISTVLASPSQSSPNLGGSEVNISSRVLAFGVNWVNHGAADGAYRPGTGKVRQDFHPTKRTCEVTLTFETKSEDEATQLAYYLEQAQLALEWQLATNSLHTDPHIATGGSMYYGGTLIIPRLQISQLRRAQTNMLETLVMTMQVMNDGTNPEAVVFGYTTVAAFLA